MKTTAKPVKKGFTLVELLVVIVIVVSIAGLSYSMIPKLMARGKATRELGNLRQMSLLFGTYAADHQMKLPACKGRFVQADGTTGEVQWNEVLLALAYPDTDPSEFRTAAWWDRNDCFMRNPRFKQSALPRGWQPLNPGYGLNEMIAENLALAMTGAIPSHEELLTVSTPLAALADPQRTPLVAPCDNYYFRYDTEQLKTFENSTLKDFLNSGKVPVLFVDGHVETISPAGYEERKLYLVPIVPIPSE
jgi:prepilin-type N-terminal cleavage/methylation domain-containing protein/prepilin-type processing-associated H-X9-DG protein